MKKGKGLCYLSIIALVISIVGLVVAIVIVLQVKNGSFNWSIKFEDLAFDKKGSVSYELPVVSDTTLSKLKVSFKKPGDKVSLLFKITNNGNVDAVLSTLLVGNAVCTGTLENAERDANNVCSNLTYTLTYENKTSVKVNDLLEKKESKLVRFTITYNPNAKVVPSHEVTVSGMDLSLIYVPS